MVSNNVAIDALISNRKSKATQAGIYFEEKVSLPGKLQIDDMDMCIVIGNILNNAIEACQRMKNEQMKKHIMLNINYKKGHIFIEVENTYDLRTVKQEEGKFISSKKYQWKYDVGLGMSNIERIINKYGGVYQTDLSEAIFKIKIMLPDVSQS
jgi:sensor histidine kinase regulating citrate/malate metabolism